MLIDIHLLTPITTRGLRDITPFQAMVGPEVNLSHSLLDRGPPSIESEFDAAMAVPDIVAKALAAEAAGAHAIIIDCMSDPGLRAAREMVNIPVLGPAETAMHVAAMLGHRFSLLTVMDRGRPGKENMALLNGLGHRLASVEAINVPVLDIEGTKEKVTDALVQAGRRSVERDRADVIILCCTGFSGLGGAVEAGLQAAGYAVPVIEPVPTALLVAAALVRVGLSHSKRAYPIPPRKPMIGYNFHDRHPGG